MNRLRPLPPRKVRKALKKLGWEEKRQKGSHLILTHPDNPELTISLPIHSTISTGVIHRLIKDLGMTVEDFYELL